MKSTLMIKDLALDKQLDRKSMSAVRGGNNFAAVGSFLQNTAQGGGFASPSTNVGVFAPVVTQTGDTNVKVDMANLTNVLGTMNTSLSQH